MSRRKSKKEIKSFIVSARVNAKTNRWLKRLAKESNVNVSVALYGLLRSAQAFDLAPVSESGSHVFNPK